jgi:hypothetical protein
LPVGFLGGGQAERNQQQCGGEKCESYFSQLACSKVKKINHCLRLDFV